MAITFRSAYPLAKVLVRPLWWVVSLRMRIRSLFGISETKSGGPSRQVLLTAYNHLTARYIAQTADLLRQDDRISLTLTRPPFADRQVPLSEIQDAVDTPYISFWRALLRPWDLLVSADHYPASMFHPKIRKIYVPHGFFAGMSYEGLCYEYGTRAVRRNGRPVFDTMIASGELERQAAIRSNDVMDGVVKVVGDPQVDRLLEQQPRYADIRSELGITPDQRAVLIMSTWGPDSLIETIGPKLLKEARELQGEYRFLLTIHPNNYTRSERRWHDFLQRQQESGIIVIGPDESWMDYLIAADAAIADYTSLGLYFAQLVRPLIYVEIDRTRFVSEAPIHRLLSFSPQLGDFDSLEEALASTFGGYPLSDLERVTSEILANRGTSAEWLLAELYDAISLQSPATEGKSGPDQG